MLQNAAPPRKKKSKHCVDKKKQNGAMPAKKIKSLQLRLGEKINQISKLYKSFLAR